MSNLEEPERFQDVMIQRILPETHPGTRRANKEGDRPTVPGNALKDRAGSVIDAP